MSPPTAQDAAIALVQEEFQATEVLRERFGDVRSLIAERFGVSDVMDELHCPECGGAMCASWCPAVKGLS